MDLTDSVRVCVIRVFVTTMLKSYFDKQMTTCDQRIL